MRLPLKRAVREHAERYSLTTVQLEQLGYPKTGQATVKEHVPAGWWAAAGMVSLIAFFLGLLLPLSNPPEDMSLRIAEEVVGNHLKQKPLEVQGHELEDMRDYFSKLDFQLGDSRQPVLASLYLLGGRYCSLQGIDAAQLRFRDTQGKLHTLFQAPHDRGVFSDLSASGEGVDPRRAYARGIGVWIWVEKGILFALTDG